MSKKYKAIWADIAEADLKNIIEYITDELCWQHPMIDPGNQVWIRALMNPNKGSIQ